MLNKKWAGGFSGFIASVWAFPIILFIFFGLLTAFKISGTSVGVYREQLYGKQSTDTNLIYGHPQLIRSDEWLGGTQIIINQSKLGFPKHNPDLGDMSLSTDVPTKDWPTIFKPQLWGFFIMPLENAFAFKWWLVMFLLIVSCYFFVLRVLPGKILFAAVFAVAIGLSPFELWWYQSGAFLVLAYGFLMIILLMRIMNREKVKFIISSNIGSVVHTIALAFIMACFGLILYPPFQIPVAISLLFFAIGYLIHLRIDNSIEKSKYLRRLGLIVLSILMASIIGLAFIASNRNAIHALNSSVYPGHRENGSGGMSFLQVFDSFVMPAEQSDFRNGHFFTNPSEASNFILLLPFLILPGIWLIWRDWHKHKKVDFVFIAIQLCALMLLARAFLPYGNSFYKIFLLQKVPNNDRLLIGLGFLGILQLVYFIKKLSEARLNRFKLQGLAIIYGAACFAGLILVGIYIRQHYPLFLHNIFLILGAAGVFSLIIVSFLANRRTTGVLLFLAFTLLSSYRVMPLYRGLGVLTHSTVVDAMGKISAPGTRWVTVGDDAQIYESFGWLAGRQSLSGVHGAPNLAMWDQVAGPSYRYVYDREAHVFFTDSPSLKAPFQLLRPNAFNVRFQCDNFIRNNAQFALSVHPLTEPCVQLQKIVNYPNTSFYLYKVI